MGYVLFVSWRGIWSDGFLRWVLDDFLDPWLWKVQGLQGTYQFYYLYYGVTVYWTPVLNGLIISDNCCWYNRYRWSLYPILIKPPFFFTFVRNMLWFGLVWIALHSGTESLCFGDVDLHFGWVEYFRIYIYIYYVFFFGGGSKGTYPFWQTNIAMANPHLSW